MYHNLLIGKFPALFLILVEIAIVPPKSAIFIMHVVGS